MYWLLLSGLGVPDTNLFSLLVENGGHVQQGAALIQGCRECLPLLLQLIGNLLNLLRGIMARFHQAIGHRHYAVYVYIHVLQKRQKKWAHQEKVSGGSFLETQTALSETSY